MNLSTIIQERDLRYDYLRAMAIVMVVFIHSSTLLFRYSAQHIGFNSEYISYAIANIIFTAVPLFVMLSGALLLGKDEPILDFYKKRFSRVVIPFATWSIIVYTITYFQEGGRSITEYLFELFNKTIFQNGVHTIYWFVYIILGLYIVTPILRIICQKAEREMMYYLFFVLLALFCTNEIMPSITIFRRFNCDNLEYLMYFIGGYVITNNSYRIKRLKTLCIAGLLTGWGLMIYRFILTNTQEDYLKIYRVIACLCIFSFFFCYGKQTKRTMLTSVVIIISEYSYGIYLCHFILLSCILRIPHFCELPVLIEFPLLAVLTLITSCISLFMGKRLGLAKFIM